VFGCGCVPDGVSGFCCAPARKIGLIINALRIDAEAIAFKLRYFILIPPFSI
jgi:hypothetical protein